MINGLVNKYTDGCSLIKAIIQLLTNTNSHNCEACSVIQECNLKPTELKLASLFGTLIYFFFVLYERTAIKSTFLVFFIFIFSPLYKNNTTLYQWKIRVYVKSFCQTWRPRCSGLCSPVPSFLLSIPRGNTSVKAEWQFVCE